MDRLLKLVDHKPSSLDQTNQEGIFDIKTYQKAIDRISCSSSLECMPPPRRLSLSHQPPSHNDYPLVHPIPKPNSFLKQEIRPHQARQIVSRITEIIKTKREASKFLSSQQKDSQRIHQNAVDKKATYSAYINARKKVFQKYNPAEPSTAHSDPNIPFPEDEKGADPFSSDYLNRQLKSQLEAHNNSLNNYMNNTMNKYQRIRLEGIVTRKRIEPKKPREQSIAESVGMEASKTRRMSRSFITVIKKRSNDSRLMINTTNQLVSRRKLAPQQPQPDNFIKNFNNQTRFQQQQIEIFPQANIVKLGKCQQASYLSQQPSARCVSILHINDGAVRAVLGVNQREKVEIASITKTMTCFLALAIAEKFCIDIKKEKIIVSERAARMQGTSAKLAYSDVLTVHEMLHALMLPSGNDAAVAIGQWGGKQIRKYSSLLRRMRVGEEESEKGGILAALGLRRKTHMKLFVHHMNKMAKYLGLNTTHFVNTHGLMNERAYSCSHNVALLTNYTMANQTFRQIVGRQTFHCRIFNRTFSHSKEAIWQNTNKLLPITGFLGVKTGITPSAGPCLTSYFQLTPNEAFIITILRTKSCQMRFKETITLLKATLLHFCPQAPLNYPYEQALANLELYSRQDFREDDKQFSNNCKEESDSNQDEDQGDTGRRNDH